uniref:CHCH domain-containing protein n=1 Tax=Chromera velia CCMP2878 TaxID=1169474 RepID=A0A0G4HL39_9ALVE|mmetsp:Transcript_7932/g.15435  ORF Transcript_7932/g.15435 Transcript_7932/m.15435 type:complete len:159 (+) Transcript_7932:152-628(+)|eukprot:Cvel_28834.t1-p1 / transcript=Cvel_28834.t1 / gene=Cvel_28834 / organism=Chromera_velia_CCMP2878 / gene_product=hypothetical protein / transcript_product=hypothetical protein / location=Cvel_scaffold3847:7041-9434(+) / protein_length=158 / sequence_SO=supercontig / SO=protein_coding / is_pseudo=false
MNGCSKRSSHRVLFPVAKLYGEFPRIEHFQLKHILTQMQKKDANVGVDHPCFEAWDIYRRCLYQKNGSLAKCRLEATTYVRCLGQHTGWKPPYSISYLHMAERWRVPNETTRWHYPKPALERVARGSAFSFEGGRSKSVPRSGGPLPGVFSSPRKRGR